MSLDSFAVLEAAGIAALQLDPHSRIIRCATSAWATLLGGEVLSVPIESLVIEEQRADWVAVLQEVACGDAEASVRELHLLHREGYRVPVRLTAAGVRASEASIVERIDLVAQPVPGSPELITSELDLFEHLFESVKAAVVVHEGPQHIIRYGNVRAREMAGNPTQFLGKPMIEVAPNRFGEAILGPIDAVYQSGTPLVLTDYHTPLYRPEQDPPWVDSYCSAILLPWRYPDGRMRGVVAFGFDVTEQVLSQQERLKNEQKLSLALDSARIGVWTYDPETARITLDERGHAYFGLGPEFTFEELLESVPPEDHSLVRKTAGETLQCEAAGCFDVEHRLRMPDGLVKWVSVLGRSQIGEDGQRQVMGVAVDNTERKLFEEALRESERRLRLALQDSPVVLFEQDTDLRYTWLHNPSMGYAIDEIVGMKDTEILEEPGGEVVAAFKRRVLAEGKRARTVVDVVRHGQRMWWDLNVEPTYDASGKISGISGVAIDVTEPRETELALRSSEARLRFTIEAARLLLYEWDIVEDRVRAFGYLHDGTPVHHEDGTWGEFGTFETAKARPTSPEGRASFERAIDQAIRETGELEWEGAVLEPPGSHLAGREAYFHQSGRVQYDAQGRPLRLYGVIVDATRRHEVEREALLQRERLQRMLEASPIGIAFLRRDGIVLESNEAFLSILNCDRETFARDGLDVLKQCEATEEQWGALLASGSHVRPRTLTIPSRTTSPTVALASVVSLEQDDDELVVFLADITERIEMEAELRKLNEALEREVHERSHAHARLRELALQQTAVEHQERRRIAQTLHDHFQQLLVAAKFSLVNAARSSPEAASSPSFSHAEELIDEAIASSRNLAVELFPPALYEGGLAEALQWLAERYRNFYGLTVHLDADGLEQPFSEEVKVYLYQAAHELLLNVIKHADTRDAWLSLKDKGKNIRLIVEDHGKGCDVDIFSQQLPRRAGFGLFQIQQRINLLGGEVTHQSVDGGGCRIELDVPKVSPGVDRGDFRLEHSGRRTVSNGG